MTTIQPNTAATLTTTTQPITASTSITTTIPSTASTTMPTSISNTASTTMPTSISTTASTSMPTTISSTASTPMPTTISTTASTSMLTTKSSTASTSKTSTISTAASISTTTPISTTVSISKTTTQPNTASTSTTSTISTTASISTTITQPNTASTSMTTTVQSTTSASTTATVHSTASATTTTNQHTTTTISTTSTLNTASSLAGHFRKKRAVKYTNQTFKLTCQQFANGVIHNILGQIINRDTISLNPVINSVGRVEMQFKSYRSDTEDALKYLPDISTVYLGDKFFMFLKYIGQQDYKIVPQSCSAYDGGVAVTNSVKPNVPLWSYDRCVSDIARKYHLMHGFEKINDKIIFAELFGFHFVDDADISVECDVMICNKADNSPMCTLEQNDCGRTKFNRRTKRTTNKYIKVVKKLKVMNRRQQYTENTAMKHRQNSLMVLIVAVVYGGDYTLP